VTPPVKPAHRVRVMYQFEFRPRRITAQAVAYSLHTETRQARSLQEKRISGLKIGRDLEESL